MKIIIPVSQSDQHLLDPFIQMLSANGPIGEHDVIFMPTANCAELVQGEYKKLANLCRSVQSVTCPRNWEGGWPVACNNHWHFAVSWLDNQLNKDVWMWLELDTAFTVPTKQAIQQMMEKYTIGYGKGQIFMGTQKPVLINGKEDPSDLIMNGVAIYPPMVSRFPTVMPLFNNMGRTGSMGIRIPFDMYLRWQFRKLGVNNITPMIEHHWKSKEYTRKGDTITFKKEGDEKVYTLSPETVLAHGCKDGSLHRLVVDEKKPLIRNLEKNEILLRSAPKDPLNTENVTDFYTKEEQAANFLQVTGEVQPAEPPVITTNLDEFNPGLGQSAVEVAADCVVTERPDVTVIDPEPPKDELPECLKVDTFAMNEKELKAFNVLKAQYEWLTKEQRRIQDFKITFDLLQKEANEVLSQFGMKTQQGGKIVKL